MRHGSTTTRLKLLDAAETLFGERGYAAVGTREIADRGGVDLASIGYHFGSKRALYLETVRRAMTKADGVDPWARLAMPAPEPFDAAVQLAGFVRDHLATRDDASSRACLKLMLWEALKPSEALTTVLEEHIAPCRDTLIAVVARIAPQADREDVQHAARSVLAQVIHHHLFRTFVERLDGVLPTDESAAHIVRFSLRGLGCPAAMIEGVVDAAVLTGTPT